MAVDRIDPKVALFHDGQFNEITGDVRGGKSRGFGIDINRGRPDESNQVDPTRVDLQLNNCNGRYSPRNPRSELFTKIGRNTPIQVYLGTPHPGAAGGGLDTTEYIAPSVDAPTDDGLLLCAFGAITNQSITSPPDMTGVFTRSTPEGVGARMTVRQETITAAGPTGTRTATVVNPQDYLSSSVLLHGDNVTVENADGVVTASDSPNILHSVLSVEAERGWWLVLFVYSQPTSAFEPVQRWVGGTESGWVRLTDSLTVPAPVAGTLFRMSAWARRVKVTGTQKVPVGELATDPTIAIVAAISGVGEWNIRATAEVSEWPPRWGQFEETVWVPVEGSGILRRLGATGSTPLPSSPQRQAQMEQAVKGYWPLSDSKDATRADSGINGPSLTFFPAGTVAVKRASFGSGFLGEWLPASVQAEPGDGSLTGGKFAGPVSERLVSPTPTNVSVDILYRATKGLSADDHPLGFSFAVITTFDQFFSISIGTGPQEEINVSGGNEKIGPPVFPGGQDDIPVSVLFDGDVHHVRLLLEANGADNVLWTAYVDGSSVANGNFSNTNRLRPPAAGDIIWFADEVQDQVTPVDFGHFTIWSDVSDFLLTESVRAFFGYPGEEAGVRIARLCQEEDILVTFVGDPSDTVQMGAQHPLTLLELLRECEGVDNGILYEPRELLGLTYRTVRSMYNQQPTLAIDYEACHLGHPLEPIDDDRNLRNDITVTREDGGSTRKVQETGPVSVQPPPDGVGRYDFAVTVNVAHDILTGDIAGWLLNLGTVDGFRYPLIRVKNLAPPMCPLDPDVSNQASGLDLGDRSTIDNLPDWMPPEQASVLAQGYQEHLDWYEWDLRFNSSPESLFQVPVVGATEGSVVDSFASPGTSPVGLTWDGQFLWNVDQLDDLIYKLNPSTRAVVDSFASPGTSPRGLTWDGEFLWNADQLDDLIYKLDPSTGAVVDSFASPGTSPQGLAWDGEFLWNADGVDDLIYKLDPSTGAVVDSFASPGINPTGLTWDGTFLWNSDIGDTQIYKINPSTGAVVDSFASPGTSPRDLAWDGMFLWVTDNSDDVIQQVASVDIQGTLVQSSSATLNQDVTTSDTSIDLHLGGGADWVHEVDYDIFVTGERMTVTAVGAASGTYPNRTQTLTVTRAINGILREHLQDDRVEFFHKTFIGL